MATAIRVIKIDPHQSKDFKDFFEFPWRLYKDDPYWTPPLLSMRRELLDPNKNPSWAYLEGAYFLARRGEEAAGTIAAFVNKRHNEYHNEHIAWFGFFESVDDPAVGRALLDAAYDWAKTHGYDAIRGPQSFTNMEECGLLVEGFTRPILLMPYNPPYYKTFIEEAGFHKVMDVFSYHADWDTMNQENVLQRFDRLVDRVKKRSNITIVPINRKNLKKDFELFKDLYNKAWVDNWGFTPFTSEELDALVESLGQFFVPELACFGYVDGEPAGFTLSIPDFNQVLQAAYARPGHPEIYTLLKALWHWKIRPKIDWIRVPLMGVLPEYRNRGVDLAMFHKMVNTAWEMGTFKHLDCGWVLETNESLTKMLSNMNLEVYKTHRFYEKAIAEA